MAWTRSIRSLHADRQTDFSIASTKTRPWTSEERDRVPQWFRARKHLPQKEVLAQFEQDFGYRRSFGAIQTASYYRSKTNGYRNPRKRRRTLPPDNPSLKPTTTELAPIAEPSNIATQSLTSEPIPRASISFLDALKSFPRSEIPKTELKQPKVSSAELLQTANAGAATNAADGAPSNERSSSSASTSEIRSPGLAVTGALLPTVGEAVSGRVSSGNGQLTQLGSTSDREGHGPCNTNTETCELGTPTGFQPVDLGSRPCSGAVDVRAHASITVGRIPTVNTDQLDTRKTDSGPAGHAAAADSDGHISLGINREVSIPGPQIVTGAQPDGGETRSDLPNKSREGISSSSSQHEHQCLSASRIVAGAFGPSRPQSSNTNRPQYLSQLSSHMSAPQQTDYSVVQFAEAQQLESQSHGHHLYHTGTAIPAAPTPSDKPNLTIQSALRKKTTRSRTGCSACRKKRLKCDENSPACENCVRSGLPCEGPRKPRKPGRKPFGQQPKEGSSSLPDANQDNIAERIDSGPTRLEPARTRTKCNSNFW